MIQIGAETFAHANRGEHLVTELLGARVKVSFRTASLRQLSNWPRPCPSHPVQEAIGSTGTLSAFRAFGRLTIRIPSLRVALTLDVSTNGGRSTTRKILSAHDMERIIFPFC